MKAIRTPRRTASITPSSTTSDSTREVKTPGSVGTEACFPDDQTKVRLTHRHYTENVDNPGEPSARKRSILYHAPRKAGKQKVVPFIQCVLLPLNMFCIYATLHALKNTVGFTSTHDNTLTNIKQPESNIPRNGRV